METEIILVVVIACVLVLDFVLRSIKKKSNDKEDVLKKEDQTGTIKSENKFNYILNRKRNIIAFLLLIAMLKPVIHFIFFEEKSDAFSTEKIDLGSKRYYNEFYLKDSIGNLNPLKYLNYTILYNDLLHTIQYYPTAIDEEIKKNYLKYGLLNRNGDPIYIGKETVFTYKREKLGFKEYFKERYTDKPFIFLISLAIIGLLSFLLNDKIKAR